MPDIDLDFPRDIREKLIVAVTERYGRRHASLVASFATYRSRGAIRDVGKALGLPFAELERLARLSDGGARSGSPRSSRCSPSTSASWISPRWRAFAELTGEIGGLPRHISQHPGGMVISSRPLVELVPVQPAAMAGRQLCQWDKDSCADAGFLKIDLLGLGMLSAVEDCVDQIAEAYGEPIDLSRIPLDDPAVYAEIQRADTVGDFQIESRAQMQSLLRTKPENLDDLTVQVALVRPGPIQGKAVHPYIHAREQLRVDPDYVPPVDHELLREPLRETHGVVVFQDQVLEVAMALAGFTVGEAEGLRRAMSRKRSVEALEAFRAQFVAGAEAKGVDAATADLVYDKLTGFSGFGFPKSHAAAFGLLAYQSAWLRHHYPAEFLCSLLNAQPMGFYPPASLVRDAQRRGVEVRSPDINLSAAGCSLEEGAVVRIGLAYVKSVGDDDATRLVAERDANGPVRGRGRPRPARAARRARAGGARPQRRLRPVGEAARPPLAARARPPPADRARERPAPALAGADRGDPGAAGSDRLGADARRLRGHEPLRRRASADAAAAAPAAGGAREPGAERGPAPKPRRLRRPRDRAPAAGDRERDRLHAARGRGRPGEPDRLARGLRAPSRDRAWRAAPARARPLRARWARTGTSSFSELESLGPLARGVAQRDVGARAAAGPPLRTLTLSLRRHAFLRDGTAHARSETAWLRRAKPASADCTGPYAPPEDVRLQYDPVYLARWYDDDGEREWKRLEETVIDRVNFEVHIIAVAERT